MKRCSKCGEEKPLTEFAPRRAQCKVCRKEYKKEYQKKYSKSDKMKEYYKEYLKEYSKEYHKSDKYREYQKEYQKSGKRKEYHNEYRKERRKSDELYAFTHRTRRLIQKSLRRRGYTKKSRTHELLGADYETVMTHLGPRPEGDAHIDHICPCSQARDEEELIKLQNYTNLRWMPAKENISKSDNWTEEGAAMCLKLLRREWEEQ